MRICDFFSVAEFSSLKTCKEIRKSPDSYYVKCIFAMSSVHRAHSSRDSTFTSKLCWDPHLARLAPDHVPTQCLT